VVVVDQPEMRIDDQDWSLLTLEMFPSCDPLSTKRTVVERGTAAQTDIVMHTDDKNTMLLEIGPSTARAWTIRVHLRPHQRILSAKVDGEELSVADLVQLLPSENGGFPLSGSGSLPPSKAGPIVEIPLAQAAVARSVEVKIGSKEVIA